MGFWHGYGSSNKTRIRTGSGSKRTKTQGSGFKRPKPHGSGSIYFFLYGYFIPLFVRLRFSRKMDDISRKVKKVFSSQPYATLTSSINKAAVKSEYKFGVLNLGYISLDLFSMARNKIIILIDSIKINFKFHYTVFRKTAVLTA
jgi:hypothetical protein